jgi:hypothetical protein
MRTPAVDYVRAVRQALTALEGAYSQAVKDATKALLVDQAEAHRKEWADFRARRLKLKRADGDTAELNWAAAINTKEDLSRFLVDTVWNWQDGGMALRGNGLVNHPEWASRGLITRWEAFDRRTLLLVVEKGRKINRYAILQLSEDLSEFSGYDFENGRIVNKIQRLR